MAPWSVASIDCWTSSGFPLESDSMKARILTPISLIDSDNLSTRRRFSCCCFRRTSKSASISASSASIASQSAFGLFDTLAVSGWFSLSPIVSSASCSSSSKAARRFVPRWSVARAMELL